MQKDKLSQYVLQKILRDSYNIHMFTKVFYDSKEDRVDYVCDVVRLSDGKVVKSPRMNTYEEALDYALNEGLKLTK